MIINHNLNAMNAQRNMAANNVNAGKSMEKLSSGLRINRAGDDAAGLAISEKMRGQIRGLDQAARNAQDGISLVQTAEGALNETHSILQRMRELGVQASTTSLESSDRTAISDELTQLNAEIDRIADTTQFNGQNLINGDMKSKFANVGTGLSGTGTSFDGSTGIKIETAGAEGAYYEVTTTVGTTGPNDDFLTSISVSKLDGAGGNIVETQTFTGTDLRATAGNTKEYDFSSLGVKVTLDSTFVTTANLAANNEFQVDTSTTNDVSLLIGANSGQTIDFSINDMGTAATALNLTGSRVDVSTVGTAQTTIDNIDSAISKVSAERSKLGAIQNRLEHTIANLGTSSENLTSAESRIRDVDMAKEMMAFSKNNILSQAAQAMLAQANQQPQGVLQLLR